MLCEEKSVPKADIQSAIRTFESGVVEARALLALTDEGLLEAVQRQTFRFFWEGAHPVSGLARDRIPVGSPEREELVAIGGSGFGIMALIVAVERGWVSREQALARLRAMLDL